MDWQYYSPILSGEIKNMAKNDTPFIDFLLEVDNEVYKDLEIRWLNEGDYWRNKQALHIYQLPGTTAFKPQKFGEDLFGILWSEGLKSNIYIYKFLY